jgi:anthranilate phosphoribosyltransferase
VGSADVLSACGVAIELGPEAAGRVLDEAGLVFLFAPAFHPAMKELGTVRRELGVRTIFNALGPLANPAGAARQLIGVGRPELVRLLADALASLGTERAIVFHVSNGLDELVPGVAAEGVEVKDGWTRPWAYDPSALPQREVLLAELAGGDAQSNAGMLERLLDGEPGARRETVLLNVAVALTVEGRAADVADGYERARSAIDSGASRASFDRMRSSSRLAGGSGR